MERTHEPCVPTCLLPSNHPAIRPILKFNIQNSKFKAQVPTLPYRSFSATKQKFLMKNTRFLLKNS